MQAQLLKVRFRNSWTVLLLAVLFHCAPASALDKDSARRVPGGEVAWRYGDSDQAVDAAFVRAKSSAQPVLLYWGASWCPPCNQLKATLFNRRDFIALAHALVPVYLDGDLPGAQKQGARFKVVGYPTLILFSADGKEITRLPGEADAARVIAVLQAGLAGGRSASLILADALSGVALSASEWQALAFYAWETDEAQLVQREKRAAVLADLARRSQDVSAEASSRLWLKSLVAPDAASPTAAAACETQPEQCERLIKVLRSADATRLNADVIIEGARTVVRTLSGPSDAARARLLAEYGSAMVRLQNDAQLSRADRTGALNARVELARLDIPDEVVDISLPQPLLTEVSAMARRMDAEISNAYERQAVITSIADLLGKAGLWSESDALLKANLKKSHAPYYLMSQLGGNARKLGRTAEALDWHERAYLASKGPATRLQWGASYVTALVDLAPQQSRRIEKAMMNLFADAAMDKGAFYDRSGRSIKRAVGKIGAWSKAGEHADEIGRLRARHRDLCRRIAVADPQRGACDDLWSAAESAIAGRL